MEALLVKVTYPQMGYLHIPIDGMFHRLGVEVIPTPPVSRKTLELGLLYAPEGVCLPYKINLGNFLEGIEQGADTLVTICGAGKCRMGFYNVVQKLNLSMYPQLHFYTLNTEHLFWDLYHFLKKASPGVGKASIVKAMILAVRELQALDRIYAAKNYYAARAKTPQRVIDLCETGGRRFASCRGFAAVQCLEQELIEQMKQEVAFPDLKPPKVVVVGEFYLLMEPYANHQIENLLLKQRIEVKKFVFAGKWAYTKAMLQTLGLYKEEKECIDQAKPYLHYHIGGEGLKSVANALKSAKNGYDGIVHVYPFGCTPEVVAQYAMKNVSGDYKLPVLTLSIDEQMSDVGLMTRVEAFADCLKRRCGPLT